MSAEEQRREANRLKQRRHYLRHRVEIRSAKNAAARKVKRERVRNTAKDRARNAVQRAVACGLLTKPKACARCKSVRRLSAHHKNYARPLSVEWLCSPCHGLAHSIGGVL